MLAIGVQKECDVLWLYGPLYNATQPQKHQQSPTCDWASTFSHYSPQQRTPSPPSVDGLNRDIESLAIADEISLSPLGEIPEKAAVTATTATEKAPVEEDEVPEAPEFPVATVAAIETRPSLPSSPDSTASDAVDAADTAVSTTTTTTTTIDVSDMHSGADTPVSPLHIDTSAPAAADKNEPSLSSLTSSPTEESTLSRPQKSALKQLGTMTQTFEELRSFTQTPQYLALTEALASFSLTSSSEASSSTLVACVEGTRSEPMSPIIDGDENGSSTFLLPIFPSPTKYHFRSHDHRRASFPKSASHPSRLNVNINLNMNVSVHSTPVAGGRRATIGGGQGSTSGHHHHHRGGRLVPSASAKQLRFSLEVQELIFLPTSPPFRISRAKPTRAHSDPAIRSATCSSFIAPQSHINGYGPQSGLPPASLHRAGLISTATASAASFENTTTTFIKVRASSSSHGSRSRVYYHDDDENRPECDFNDDDYYFEDCRENSGYSTTDEEVTDGDDELDDSEDLEDDDEYDEFNGLGRKRHQHRHRQHTTSRRYRLSSKDAIVARRANGNDTAKAAAGPSVLWQVYTAVTGVKELIAWYGSMVYHSSSL
ncbi:hypothetical protein BGZ97_012167 [Linnemannia gamsii]|uniref:Uncharacterized protein n=1 Tax=Linnemannia gamsii TaxID=64522 RepID=A0A9P6UM83_9FUNG|nr:hypothetical protein BGZ97_012167 [Linnemannia gamsii]